MIIHKSPKQIDQIVNVTLDSEIVIYNTYVYIFIIKDLQPKEVDIQSMEFKNHERDRCKIV